MSIQFIQFNSILVVKEASDMLVFEVFYAHASIRTCKYVTDLPCFSECSSKIDTHASDFGQIWTLHVLPKYGKPSPPQIKKNNLFLASLL